MTHWANKYIGQAYTLRHDCYYWFCRILREQFNRDVVLSGLSCALSLKERTKIMSSGAWAQFGYSIVEKPQEGDAVFLGNGRVPHHIGIVIYVGAKMMILHALEGSGVVASDRFALKTNNLNIMSVWGYRENDNII